MRKVIVTFNIIWDYHTRLPKMFWYVTACKNINLGIYNKQIRFYAPRTSLETMSDVLNLCIKNKCPKNHDWAFIFHNWELKLKIEYFMVLKLQITQKFLCLLSRGSGPLCSAVLILITLCKWALCRLPLSRKEDLIFWQDSLCLL